jgi:hypothetical protein
MRERRGFHAANLMKKQIITLLAAMFILTACGPSPEAQAALTATAAWTETPTSTLAPLPTFTFTPTITLTPTPTLTSTPTIAATPTFSFPTVTVNQQAHCRYGPSAAYLHAADLYAGDAGSVRGRAVYSNWLQIKFDKINYFCWVAPSVVDLVGDISNINRITPDLQSIGSNRYGQPQNVSAVRNGDEVTISWDQVSMTTDDDRGYFIEAFVCQKSFLIWWTFSYPDQFTTSYTVKDEAGCASPSSGQIYVVEKHGYSQPVDISWPALR